MFVNFCRLLNVKDIVDRLHCNVCLLEYRGYGHSDGNPSEDGIYMDAQAALDYLTKTYQRSDVIDPRKVISITSDNGYATFKPDFSFNFYLCTKYLRC